MHKCRISLMPRTLLVVAVLMGSISSELTNCYGDLCFRAPRLDKNFYDAKAWCESNNSSTLVAVPDSNTQKSLSTFMSPAQQRLTFINIKLVQSKTSTWFLLNNDPYLGGINDQNPNDYHFYCYLQRFPGQQKFHVHAAKPTKTFAYICEFNVSSCSSISPDDSNFFDQKCYVKYEDTKLNWFQAREKCVVKGGDLATFNYNSKNFGEKTPNFNTSWLNSEVSYWVGIRWRNLSWRSPWDSSNEIIYTNWSPGKPNNIAYECVCLDPNGSPAWSWTDCEYDEQRPFVCLNKVTATATMSTATTTPNITNIAIGVGVGGFLILLVLAVIVVVILKKRKSRKITYSGHHATDNVDGQQENMDNTKSKSPTTGIYAQVVPTDQPKEEPTSGVVYSSLEIIENPYSYVEDARGKKTQKSN